MPLVGEPIKNVIVEGIGGDTKRGAKSILILAVSRLLSAENRSDDYERRDEG